MTVRSAPLFVLLLAAGCTCGEPCNPDTDVPRCEGNTVVSCPQPGVDQIVGANRWVRRDCEDARVCVVADGDAFCALSAEPNGLCDGGAQRACEDSEHQLGCQDGFATYRFDCLRCDVTDAGAECTGGPSSRCTTDADCAATLTCSSLGYCGGRRDGGR